MANSPIPRLLAVFLAVLFIESALAADESLSGIAKVQSDRLEVEHGAKRARFFGNVKATYRSLKLECKEMTVEYDESGDVTALLAKGGVIVRSKEAVAKARSAHLDAKRGLLVLEGNPTLVRGSNRLEGSRIEIALSSGRLEVIDARGTFKIGEDEN